jgi:hypothetical protein
MTISNAYKDCMTQTVTISGLSSRDSYGKPTFGTSTSHKAHIVNQVRMLGNPFGEDLVGKGTVYIFGTTTATNESILTLPDGSTPPILDVTQRYDETGRHHDEIIFGSM